MMPRRNDIAKVLIVAIAVPAFACMEVPARPRRVSSSFSVHVLKFSHPVPGVTVRLVHHYDDYPVPTIPLQQFPEIGRSVTDANGIAHFTNAPTGEYDVVADMRVQGDIPKLFVKVGRLLANESKEITLAAPALEFLRSRSMAGVLNLSPTDTDMQLHLIAAETGELIETEHLNNGAFRFTHALLPGPYLLRFEGKLFRDDKPGSLGDMGVWLDPSLHAPASINADVTISDCGVWYATGCSRPMVEIPRVCGRFIDELGASIPMKEVDLLDNRSEVVARTKTTVAGDFDFGTMPGGQYVLRSAPGGFVPAVQPVVISEKSDSTCLMPMTIVLQMPGRGCKTTVGVRH